MKIDIIKVDYQQPSHCNDLLLLLNQYAVDPMGGGAPLSSNVKDNLISQLKQKAFMSSFVCYVEGKPAAFANCIESFSTFKCLPVLNIHDFAVSPDFRGLGLSQRLMDSIQDFAQSIGCCKITLEVLTGNTIAQNAYLKAGFKSYELDPSMGTALFWEKPL